MSFIAAATTIGFTGTAATIAAGAMMGGTMTVGMNVVQGRDPFDNIGQGILMGGLTAGISPFVGETLGVGASMATGITAGALGYAATGDIGKGLTAGLSAYGLAEMSGNLEAAGGKELADAQTVANANAAAETTANAARIAPSSSTSSGTTSVEAYKPYSVMKDVAGNPIPIQNIDPTVDVGANASTSLDFQQPQQIEYTGEFGTNANVNTQQLNTATFDSDVASSAVPRVKVEEYKQMLRNQGMSDEQIRAKLFDAGKEAVGSDLRSAGKFAKANAKNLMYAAAPIFADAGVQGNMPKTVTKPGMIRPYSYDPYSGRYTAGNPYEVMPAKAAEGGLMGMADGGYNPGQLDFVQRSEPVVRMAQGGIVALAAGGAAPFGANIPASDIKNWFATNQGADDKTIAAAMKQYGIGTLQLANAMGFNPDEVTRRFNIATGQPIGTNRSGVTLTGDALEAQPQSTPNPVVAEKTPEQLSRDSLNYYRDNFQGKRSAVDGTPFFDSYEQYLQLNPIKTTTAAPVPPTTGQSAAPSAFSAFSSAAAQTPAGGYTTYTPEEIGGYLKANPKADLAAALKQFNADPRAVSQYITGLTQGYLDPTQTTGGTGTLKYYDALRAQGIDANELFDAFKSQDPNYTFDRQGVPAMQRAFDVATNFKGFDPKGATQLDKDIAWVKKMDELKLNYTDIARLTGLPISEVSARGKAAYNAMRKTAPPPITDTPNLPGGVSGGGNTVVNPGGTITTAPAIPGRPEGGFTGTGQVNTGYEQAGGSLGYLSPTYTSEEYKKRYEDKLTGGSKQSYDYLTGKTPYSPTPYTPTGEVQKPYAESVLGMPASLSGKQYLFDSVTKKYRINPDYAIPTRDDKGKVSYGLTNKDVVDYFATSPTDDALLDWATTNNLSAEQIAAATGMPISEVYKRLKKGKPAKVEEPAAGTPSNNSITDVNAGGGGSNGEANGGLMKLARGGMTQQFDLGGYSDGGRLLRGPGDGVSDSIPATIGNKRPARLADGEFVVPARIVSELGNGSTEAGARKLYAMMNRVQAARRGTVGKKKVAKNSRADKYLPA